MLNLAFVLALALSFSCAHAFLLILLTPTHTPTLSTMADLLKACSDVTHIEWPSEMLFSLLSDDNFSCLGEADTALTGYGVTVAHRRSLLPKLSCVTNKLPLLQYAPYCHYPHKQLYWDHASETVRYCSGCNTMNTIITNTKPTRGGAL